MKYKVSPQGKKEEKARLLPSCRMGLTALLTSGIAVMALLRLSLTISLVCMVKKPSSLNQTFPATPGERDQTDVENNASRRSSSTSGQEDYLQTTETYVTRGRQEEQFEGEFDWTRQQLGVLLAAYFYGFCLTQLFGGYLAGRFGGKHVFGIATLISTIATLLCPVAARFNLYLFIALRIVLGLASGVLVPTMSTLLGLWIPPLERSFIISVVGTGFTIGVVIASLISSQFCIIPVDNGWPLTFYVTGAVSFAFWVVWNIFAFSSPYDHPRISEAELNYIRASNKLQSTVEIKRKPFPILKALLSPAVLATIAANLSVAWYSHTQATTLPFYLRDVLRFDIKQNGLYSLLPHVLSVLFCPPMGYLADIIQSKKIVSTATARKIFMTISNFGCALLLLGVSFSDYNIRYMVVVFLIINVSVGSMSRMGTLVNTQDIAPRYSGEILGISNTAGALTGVVAPIIVGFITTSGSADEWRKVFYIAIAILVGGGLIFVVFAEGEVLPWAKDDTSPEDGDEKRTSIDKAKVLFSGHQDGQYDNSVFQAGDERAIEKKISQNTAIDKKEKTLGLDTRL